MRVLRLECRRRSSWWADCRAELTACLPTRWRPMCLTLHQVKGKAAIDVLGARLGKSGGALVQQGLVVAFGSILTGSPILATLFALVGVLVECLLPYRLSFVRERGCDAEASIAGQVGRRRAGVFDPDGHVAPGVGCSCDESYFPCPRVKGNPCGDPETDLIWWLSGYVGHVPCPVTWHSCLTFWCRAGRTRVQISLIPTCSPVFHSRTPSALIRTLATLLKSEIVIFIGRRQPWKLGMNGGISRR